MPLSAFNVQVYMHALQLIAWYNIGEMREKAIHVLALENMRAFNSVEKKCLILILYRTLSVNL